MIDLDTQVIRVCEMIDFDLMAKLVANNKTIKKIKLN